MSEFSQPVAICWFRRDLRLADQTALFHALQSGHPVQPVFIFDTHILDKLSDKRDARVTFIHRQLERLQEEMRPFGASLDVRVGRPEELWPEILADYRVAGVYTNRDYEPYALERDGQVAAILNRAKIPFHTYKDQVIFEKDEVLKDDGGAYTVFTPYSRKWMARLRDAGQDPLREFSSENFLENLFKRPEKAIPALASFGFVASELAFPPDSVPQKIIREYDKKRNFPAENGTSRLGVHFRFGTISIREKARKALDLNQTYLNELIWRDFYSQILAHFPHVVEHPFKRQYDRVVWRNNEAEFKRWCEGVTGYPIVDAGMRELNATGYMHNRVRMITASFLTKHLLIDWRWGEAYFAEKLLDFDLASNNGGWQWAAGCGTDAAPYFRIFNPEEQQKKFDADGSYVRRWVPEWGRASYPPPVVEHKFARERCLSVYKAALGGG